MIVHTLTDEDSAKLRIAKVAVDKTEEELKSFQDTAQAAFWKLREEMVLKYGDPSCHSHKFSDDFDHLVET